MSVSLRNFVPAQFAQAVPAGSRPSESGECARLRRPRCRRARRFAVQRGVEDRLVAAFAQENGDGHAPDALAADAPVGAGGDHVGDAFLAPAWIPDDLVDLLDAELPKGGFGAVLALDRRLQADEPLLGGAEDDRLVAAPAVGVGVVQVGHGQQCAGLLQHGHDDGVGGPDLLAFERRRRGVIPALSSTWMWPEASTRSWGRGRSAGRCRSRLRRGRARCGRRRCRCRR
jgi:hypothetical protein